VPQTVGMACAAVNNSPNIGITAATCRDVS
jgi:hypothetical protein